jgi:hypothetical protein
MVAPGIVKFDRALYQPQAEYADIEVQVALRIVGDRGHVMQA